MEMIIPENVKSILEKLNREGYEAYIVGDCICDNIIGLKPHHWDICTSAEFNEIAKIFPEYEGILSDSTFRFITVICNQACNFVESQRPQKICSQKCTKDSPFISALRKYLRCRNFTISSMAFNPSSGLIDFFNGENDIKNKTVRCIGNPNKMFQKNALEILKAIEFSIKWDFQIESKTLCAIFEKKELLKNVPFEKINFELLNVLSYGYNIVLGKVLQSIVPELTNKMITDAMVMIGIFDAPLYVRLSLLFNFGKAEQEKILNRLKFDNKIISKISDIQSITYEIRGMTRHEELQPENIIKYIKRKNSNIINEVLECLRCTSYLDGNTIYYVLYERILAYMLEQHQSMNPDTYDFDIKNANNAAISRNGFITNFK